MQIEENGLNSVNVREVLLEMRKSRMGLIQTPDQLRFSYLAIIEGAKQLPSNNVVNNTNLHAQLDETIELCCVWCTRSFRCTLCASTKINIKKNNNNAITIRIKSLLGGNII